MDTGHRLRSDMLASFPMVRMELHKYLPSTVGTAVERSRRVRMRDLRKPYSYCETSTMVLGSHSLVSWITLR